MVKNVIVFTQVSPKLPVMPVEAIKEKDLLATQWKVAEDLEEREILGEMTCDENEIAKLMQNLMEDKLSEIGVDALVKATKNIDTTVTRPSVIPKPMVGTIENQVEKEMEAQSSALGCKKIVFQDPAIVETSEKIKRNDGK